MHLTNESTAGSVHVDRAKWSTPIEQKRQEVWRENEEVTGRRAEKKDSLIFQHFLTDVNLNVERLTSTFRFARGNKTHYSTIPIHLKTSILSNSCATEVQCMHQLRCNKSRHLLTGNAKNPLQSTVRDALPIMHKDTVTVTLTRIHHPSRKRD